MIFHYESSGSCIILWVYKGYVYSLAFLAVVTTDMLYMWKMNVLFIVHINEYMTKIAFPVYMTI